MSSIRRLGTKSRRSNVLNPTMPRSMARPTTPTRKAPSTASGKTQKTSMPPTGVSLHPRGVHDESASLRVDLRDVLVGEGHVELLPVLAPHDEHVVGGRLEEIGHAADERPRRVVRLKAHEIPNVELPLLGLIELA